MNGKIAAFAAAALIAVPALAAEEPADEMSTAALLSDGIVIENPWAVSLKDDELIVFMAIHNSAGNDKIYGVTSEGADEAALAKFDKTLTGGGMVSSIVTKADEVTYLDQDGYHVHLTGLKEEPQNGGSVKVTLSFEEAGDLEIEVSVSVVR